MRHITYAEGVASDHGDVIRFARARHREEIGCRAVRCRKMIEYWCHSVADDLLVRVVFGDDHQNMFTSPDRTGKRPGVRRIRL
jgi:hypothetical protein